MRVKNIAEVYTGNSIAESIKRAKYTNLTEGYNYIGTKDVGFDNVIDYENGVKIPKSEPKFRYAFPNDILLCIEGGSAGRKIGILREQVCFGNKLCNFHQYFNSSSYMYYFLQTPSFVAIFKENMTGIIGGVSRDKIQNILFPLPPLEEQKRIVSKIESLEPFIDDYNQAETELSELNETFPEQIKKSILQYAIQGKLVPQDPSDEPASVLLDKIKAEKRKLIKAGKIKKDKVESYIYKRDNRHYEKIGDKEVDITDEIPFEIPDSWEWVRLKKLGETSTGTTPSKSHPEYFGNFLPFIGPGNLQDNRILPKEKGISKEGCSFCRIALPNTILQVCIGGSIGKIGVVEKEVAFNQQINAIQVNSAIDFSFIFYVLSSNYFQKNLKEHSTGTATPIINRSDWESLLVPLAPLEEQKRIVDKLEQIFEIVS